MASRLTVIFYIVLCLEAGIVLTIVPWVQPFGMGDWGDNFILLYASQKIGLQGLQQAVSSGWVRGAVTGLGLLNLAMAFWEMAHFRQTVRKLQAHDVVAAQPPAAAAPPPAAEQVLHTPAADDSPRLEHADHIPDNERRDDARHAPVE
ncbi:MAG TPA: hypothetical protein VM934_09145 [Pyrinomonadaceae bacterium]|nr:hypothetical protein [Pyrinomonadaceae bacterium]